MSLSGCLAVWLSAVCCLLSAVCCLLSLSLSLLLVLQLAERVTSLSMPSVVACQAEVVKKRVLVPIDEMVLHRGVWGYCPWVRVHSKWWRAVVFGLVAVALGACPLIAVLSFAIDAQSGIAGAQYCVLKAVFAAVLAALAFPAMFVSAISTDKFRGTPLGAALQAAHQHRE